MTTVKGEDMDLYGLYQVVLLGVATSVISVTISKGKIFKSLRKWVGGRSDALGVLVECRYCVSHWVALVLTIIYRPSLVPEWTTGGLVISGFVMVAIAAFVSRFIKNPEVESIPFGPGRIG